MTKLHKANPFGEEKGLSVTEFLSKIQLAEKVQTKKASCD
jgi:hypothetical protein